MNPTRSRGKWLTKTFVPLLDVMKSGREHETACCGGGAPRAIWRAQRIPTWSRKARGVPRPAHTLTGWVFLLERLGKHKYPPQPHMKGVIREQHPALTKSGQRSKAESSIKPHQHRELLLGMDSCGTPPTLESLTAGRECQANTRRLSSTPYSHEVFL